MHPSIVQYMDQYEREAKQRNSYRTKLGKFEIIFLEEVWGPLMNHNFQGLYAEYPFKDSKNGDRFADYVYTKGGMRLLIEIDGYTTHARNISLGDFEDHLARQNDLVLSGWLILRFSAQQVEKQPSLCQRQITQAIGSWWTQVYGSYNPEDDTLWILRKRKIVQIAQQLEGKVRTADLIREFQITGRTANNWLKRFTEEGMLTPNKVTHRTTSYQLQHL